MSYDNPISHWEKSLDETRSQRNVRMMELTELEAKVTRVRRQISALDDFISTAEANLSRLHQEALASSRSSLTPTDAELEAAMARDAANAAPGYGTPGSVYRLPTAGYPVEAADKRFADRTIPQATSMILRESGGALHVNDIYEHLLAGGFNFTGHNPTISIAVSLNRNRRFRKVAPGTFDLVMRDAVRATS